MRNTLKVYYANVNNMGDILTRDIIENCFGYEVERHTYLTAEISGIGSGLGNYMFEDVLWKNVLKALTAPFFPQVYIWGTGFINREKKDTRFYKRDIRFCAVRGELSKSRVEKILGRELNIPLADAGILSSELLKDAPKKKYAVGIIPHYKEQNHPAFCALLDKFEDSVLIDVKKEPIGVIEKIAECEVIISSSLHGLIISDSLGIPNRHVVVTHNLLGDGFKFDDYYSAYGMKHEYVDLNNDDVGSLSDIIRDYPLTKEIIEQKKTEMIECFPFPVLKTD